MLQIPKKMAVDIITISCIIVMAFVAIIFFIGLLPLFIQEPITPPPIQQKPVDIEVSVPSEATPGQVIISNILITNLGDEPVENIRMELAKSEVFKSSGQLVKEILPRKTKETSINITISGNASLGDATGAFIFSTGNYSTMEPFMVKIVK
ncbi:MAG: hypothetical protein J7L23_02245 [Candidatus Diapherotrites archaeon]|nr:hypothetical protein [Candidatus Diapherotrites archaeon]